MMLAAVDDDDDAAEDDGLLDDDDDEEDDQDVPADWSEEDILAELVDDDDLDGEEEEKTKNSPSTAASTGATDDDAEEDEILMKDDEDEEEEEDDDEDDDIEMNIDDDEDDEDDLVEEEIIGQAVEEEDDDDELLPEDEEFILNQLYDDDWDEDEDGGGDYELMEDDPTDPNYAIQKQLVDQAIADAQERQSDESFNALDFVQNQLTEEDADMLDELPFMKEVQERMSNNNNIMELTAQDAVAAGVTDLQQAVADIPDLLEDDPYPRHDDVAAGEPNLLEQDVGLTDDDMEKLDDTYKELTDIVDHEPYWDKVMVKDEFSDAWSKLSNQTYSEMEAALDEIGGSAYNVSKWLLYDLDFNVTNLMLAAVKHNRNAPILFQHWYPQLVCYERYQQARDRNFDFTWEDVEQADVEELQRYYAGFGYPEIPSKPPAETGMIGLEDLDEDEIKMAAFENWVTDVYNAEVDRIDFDDDNLRDEDNVFSRFYHEKQHPDLPSIEDAEDDIDEWHAQFYGEDEDNPEMAAYRDRLGQKFEYQVVEDEEFNREFRGHLIIACTAEDADLQVAERISQRFEKEFGKQVFVETRVLALARPEDGVYEIWLESYEIDLLHSKRRALSNPEDWKGPAQVDDAQLDYLVERVRFLISDNARYSYRHHDFLDHAV